ncbi:MAG: hypothetical protein ABIR19_07575 [Ginsengibacter sp.]
MKTIKQSLLFSFAMLLAFISFAQVKSTASIHGNAGPTSSPTVRSAHAVAKSNNVKNQSVKASKGVAMRTEARSNGKAQATAHANVNGQEHANSNSVFGAATSTESTGGYLSAKHKNKIKNKARHTKDEKIKKAKKTRVKAKDKNDKAAKHSGARRSEGHIKSSTKTEATIK